jgi:cob(I)alamin adenosyltransferase
MVRLTRIYTRTGDDGTTALVGGERRRKDDLRVEAVGAVDEANAAIGLARSSLDDQSRALDPLLAKIQNDLFDLGADLAAPQDRPSGPTLRIAAERVAWLEGEIDRLNAPLAPLTSFVLPAGTPAAAALHLARTVTRRAERRAVQLAAHETVSPAALHFLNRLSDFLFVAARAANAVEGDVLWVPGGAGEA